MPSPKIDDRFARYRLRHERGLPPHPAGPRVVRWLAANAGQIGPVCRYDLTREPVLIFDWTAGSADLAELEALPDKAAQTDRAMARIREAGAVAGIGRYREPRGIYRTDSYATADSNERRTVHMGIDIFFPAGEEILAPLDGRVHLVADNAADGDYGPLVILEHATGEGDCFFTLYGHLSPETLDHARPGAAVRRGDVIGWCGAPPRNGNWVPHLHFQIILDLLDRGADIEGVVRRSEVGVWEGLFPNPNLILRIPAAVDCTLDDAVGRATHGAAATGG